MKVQVDPALPSAPIRLEHRPKCDPLVPLATTTTAMTEAGSFYTLVPHENGRAGRKKNPDNQNASAIAQDSMFPSPRLLPLDADSLVLRWRRLGEAVLPGEAQPYNLVEWSDELPRRLGHYPVFDTALECMITGVVYFIDRNPLNLIKAQDQICKAMSNIREGMFSTDCEMIQDMILLSINAVASAEVSQCLLASFEFSIGRVHSYNATVFYRDEGGQLQATHSGCQPPHGPCHSRRHQMDNEWHKNVLLKLWH